MIWLLVTLLNPKKFLPPKVVQCLLILLSDTQNRKILKVAPLNQIKNLIILPCQWDLLIRTNIQCMPWNPPILHLLVVLQCFTLIINMVTLVMENIVETIHKMHLVVVKETLNFLLLIQQILLNLANRSTMVIQCILHLINSLVDHMEINSMDMVTIQSFLVILVIMVTLWLMKTNINTECLVNIILVKKELHQIEKENLLALLLLELKEILVVAMHLRLNLPPKVIVENNKDLVAKEKEMRTQDLEVELVPLLEWKETFHHKAISRAPIFMEMSTIHS
mmetsp:Transcript_65796/g.99198  ORF Transcript_65796/g.99198 Transcript_65796/m.99198 type:complete len:279 (+) Transcript_65796:1118-1954(+)